MSFKRYRGPDIKEQIIRNKMRRLSKRLDLVACDYILDPYLEDGSNDDITCDYSGI